MYGEERARELKLSHSESQKKYVCSEQTKEKLRKANKKQFDDPIKRKMEKIRILNNLLKQVIDEPIDMSYYTKKQIKFEDNPDKNKIEQGEHKPKTNHKVDDEGTIYLDPWK